MSQTRIAPWDEHNQKLVANVHPDDWTRLAGEFDAIRSSASSALYSTARVRCSDGSWRPLEGVAIKVLSEGGADVYLVSCGDAAERPTAH